MDLYIVTSGDKIKSEKELLFQMFSLGLQRLHFRKPGWSIQEIEKYFSGWDAAMLSKIIIHSGPGIQNLIPFGGIHIPEKSRRNNNRSELGISNQILVSTSVHSIQDFNKLEGFDYAFYGPIFNSISKKNYPGSISVPELQRRNNFKVKMIAIGGIVPSKIQMLNNLKFDGAAILGYIWGARDPLKKFIAVKQACQQEIVM